MNKNKSFSIFDFETLSTDKVNGVVLSLAKLTVDEDKLNSSQPYKFLELVSMTQEIKFDVADQVKNYGRKINKDTLNWWSEQSEEAKTVLKPSPGLDRPLDNIKQFVYDMKDSRLVFSRGDFDPLFLDYILQDVGGVVPFQFWAWRDTRSYIDGLSYGTNLKNSFIPPDVAEDFIPHNASHDVSMDIYRIQTLIQAIK